MRTFTIKITPVIVRRILIQAQGNYGGRVCIHYVIKYF